MKQLTILLYCMGFSLSALAQQAPFSRGVNLTQWFQAGSPQQIVFNRYSKLDFERIQQLGCDVIRLPINLHYMTDGAPNYTLDPLFLQFLDQAVDWAEEVGLHLILDNHTFDPAVDTHPQVGDVLNKVWLQMASHYRDRSELIYYEVLNEPRGISDALWNRIQQEVVATIRSVDTVHTIVVGGAGWNSYNNLAPMPVYEDDNLIYTFHFYDPFIFTHQGASWSNPPLGSLAGVPFPYAAGNMPSLPPELYGTWIASALNGYASEGNVARVQEQLDIAIDFMQNRNVPVFCGEFGVYRPNSENSDRVFWYKVVREYLEAHGIAWTSWDYHGGFGLYEAGTNGFFDHNLNVPLLEALGFNVPPQTPYEARPDSVGFVVYDDYLGEQVLQFSQGTADISYYATEQPNYGTYAIRWSGAERYRAMGFDFRPNKDLSRLVAEGYALDLFLRGNYPDGRFDLRFLDTKTDEAGDRPWRIRVTIDEDDLDWDGNWHHLHLPLSSFEEQGAWDDGWYPPEGKFDWSAIDRLELVTEHHALGSAELWMDQVVITNQDTARVQGTVSRHTPSAKTFVRLYPNPGQDRVFLTTNHPHRLHYELVDLTGRRLQRGHFLKEHALDLAALPAGTYSLRMMDKSGSFRTWRKLVKQ